MDLMTTTLTDSLPAQSTPARPEPPTAPPPSTDSATAQREEFLVSVFAWD